MKVKRFVLFAGEQYYPSGGWEDYDSSFDTLEEAKTRAQEVTSDWRDIVDLETGEVVK